MDRQCGSAHEITSNALKDALVTICNIPSIAATLSQEKKTSLFDSTNLISGRDRNILRPSLRGLYWKSRPILHKLNG